MKMLRSALPTLVVGIAMLALGAVRAGAAPEDAEPHHRHKPPKEAFVACEGHAKGDACEVKMPDHTMSGVCKMPPKEGATALVCVPDHPPGPPPAQ